MGLISKMFSKKEEEEEVFNTPEAEVTEGVAEDTAEAPVPEEGDKIVDLPEGKVNRVPTKYVPAPKPNPAFDPDSNEKLPDTPSFL